MHNERIISELQNAHGRFFDVKKGAERILEAQANDLGAKLMVLLAQGLMAQTEAMIQSELRAQDFMRQAMANQAAQTAKKG